MVNLLYHLLKLNKYNPYMYKSVLKKQSVKSYLGGDLRKQNKSKVDETVKKGQPWKDALFL